MNELSNTCNYVPEPLSYQEIRQAAFDLACLFYSILNGNVSADPLDSDQVDTVISDLEAAVGFLQCYAAKDNE